MTYTKPARFASAKWQDVPENIKATVKSMRDTRRGAYIHGSVGTGKTHTLHAIGEYLKKEMKIRVRYHNTVEMLREIKADFDRHFSSKTRLLEDVLDFPGVLILDDIGAEKMSEYVSETFYLIVNKRYEQMLPTFFSSNCNLDELSEKIGDRTASRIVGMSDVFELAGRDRRLSPSAPIF